MSDVRGTQGKATQDTINVSFKPQNAEVSTATIDNEAHEHTHWERVRTVTHTESLSWLQNDAVT